MWSVHHTVAGLVTDKVGDNRAEQTNYYRERVDPETEITRPHCYPTSVRFLLDFKLAQTLELLGQPVQGMTALVVCAGSGMDSEYLFRRGMRVIAADLSLDALRRAKERARRYGLDYALVVADAEHLPFRNGAVDLTFVHDGLHHLPDPIPAIREMIRTCSKAVAIAEPAQAPITRLAVLIGLSGNYEDVGNYVYRFTPKQLRNIFEQAGMIGCTFRQHLIYCQPWTFRIYRLFEPAPLSWLFRFGFYVLNLMLGRWGNSLKAVAWKTSRNHVINAGEKDD